MPRSRRRRPRQWFRSRPGGRTERALGDALRDGDRERVLDKAPSQMRTVGYHQELAWWPAKKGFLEDTKLWREEVAMKRSLSVVPTRLVIALAIATALMLPV